MEFWSGDVFFIVGASRSGTTWVRHLLNAHDRVLVGEESYFFDDVYPSLRKHYATRKRPTGLQMYVTPSQLDHAAALLFRSLAGYRMQKKPSATIFGEKTPAHVRRLAAIKAVFPQAKIVHVVRDVRDVVASMMDAAASWAPNSTLTVERSARLWGAAVSAGLEGERAYETSMLRVRYEDLIDHPAKAIKRLFAFVDIDMANHDAHAIAERCAFERYSNGRAPGTLGGAGQFYRSGIAGGWRSNLSAADVEIIESVAFPLMREIGYDRA